MRSELILWKSVVFQGVNTEILFEFLSRSCRFDLLSLGRPNEAKKHSPEWCQIASEAMTNDQTLFLIFWSHTAVLHSRCYNFVIRVFNLTYDTNMEFIFRLEN